MKVNTNDTADYVNRNLTRREALRLGFTLSAFTLGAAMPGVAWAALPSAPAPRDFDTDPVTTTKLTDSLSVLSGPGGNIAVLVGADGILQVDSGVPSRSADIAQAIAALSPKPVGTLINTHWHFDHTGGNAAVGKAGARILAQENTRKRLSTEQKIDFFKMTIPPSPAEALPSFTFTDSMELYINGEEIALAHVAPAHTDTDILIHFRQANVLHAGDTLFNGFYPFIDYSSKGWIGGMIAAADHILKITDDKTRIIPGHGPMATRAYVARYRDMLHTVQSRIEPMVRAGKTQEQIVAAKPTKELDAQWGNGMLRGDQFAAIVYAGLRQHGSAKQS